MNDRQLRSFVLAAREGSFPKAASASYISTPAFAQQINLLEKDVGFPLFVRTHRGVSLTPAGERFLDAARQILDLYDEAVSQGRALSEAGGQALRIAHRMRSGVGMLITGVANVDESGKGFEGELAVADDRFVPGLRKLANAIHERDSLAILQIFSAGRKTTSAILRGQQPYSASAVARERGPENVPHALSGEEVERPVADFGQATRRAIEAGFDGVEIHGANTYLIQQFFSPQSNRRTDR